MPWFDDGSTTTPRISGRTLSCAHRHPDVSATQVTHPRRVIETTLSRIDRNFGGAPGALGKGFSRKSAELFLVEEIQSDHAVFFSRSDGGESWREGPLHADQLRVGLRQIFGITERDLGRNLLLERQASLRERGSRCKRRIDFQLTHAEY